MTFDNKAAVAIVRTQAGGLHVLTRTITGSGYGYEAEGRVLRGKGREATWTDRGTAALKCGYGKIAATGFLNCASPWAL